MVVPRLSSRISKGSYLDEGPSQEQIDRRKMIRQKLCLSADGVGDDDIDSVAGDEQDFLEQLTAEPSTPSSSSYRDRPYRSASPQQLYGKRLAAPLKRSKSNEGEGILHEKHSIRSHHSSRISRSYNNTEASSDHVRVPKRSSSFGSFSGFFKVDKSEHRNQSGHSRTASNSNSSRRGRRCDGDNSTVSKQIVCLGKSYRNSLSLEDDSGDEMDLSRRDSSRRTRTTCLPNIPLPTATPKRSKSLGSNVTKGLEVFTTGTKKKKFHSLLKSKREKQHNGGGEPPSPSTTTTRSFPRKSKSLGRSNSGDVDSAVAMAQFTSPGRSSSWDGPGYGGSPRLRLERRNGILPGVVPSPVSSPYHRPKFPCLDREMSETDETVSMDSNSFRSKPSSASSREEILSNAVRRAKERQLKKQQQRESGQRQDLQNPEAQPAEYPIHSQGVFTQAHKSDRTDVSRSPSRSRRSEYPIHSQGVFTQAQQKDRADVSRSPSRSRRSGIFGSIRDPAGSLFATRTSHQRSHSAVQNYPPPYPSQQLQQQQPTKATLSSSCRRSYDNDPNDDADDSIVSEDDEEHRSNPISSSSPGIFERGLKALEQIYDELNL
ncbi:hypothetical protein IV203_025653 [Nitzschia inconspicua]|uniref:Uncharacterized protein n=1 Tax=Nitzschia inconspicua TaxID=303405 RepID=A0A9K3LH53_9STRA|nr:hypothetical protein IV203_025653 [Nitzschia inconspicua]